MVKVTNVFGDEYSGQAGHAGVFAKWKGIQYRRKYVIPSNPNTTMQQTIRSSFTVAVDLWHTFLSLQRQAYAYLASGQAMSGFNLHISRWQQMTEGERASYVLPYLGIKQVGSTALSDEETAVTKGAGEEYQLTHFPVAIGQHEITEGGTPTGAIAFVDLIRGKVTVIGNQTGALTIDYTSAGRTITGEALATDPQDGDVLFTDYWPIDYGSVTVKLATVATEAVEVDVVEGKVLFTETLPTGSSATVVTKYYTPIESAKLELKKVDTSFITWRGYSDEDGMISLAQTSEDGARDFVLSAAGKQSEIRANVSAEDASEDEYIQLTT